MDDINQLAADTLEEIEHTINDNAVLTAEELMNEITIIVEEYNETIDNRLINPDDSDINGKEPFIYKDIDFNKSFFLDKAKNAYFKKNNLTDESFDKLVAVQKNKHRTGIKKMYEQLVEKAKTIKIQGYSSNPFGVVKRTEIESEFKDLEDEPITQAQREWIDEQIAFYEEKIEAIERMIKDFEKSLSLEKVSGQLYWATQEKIAELENEKKDLQKQLNQYLVKK
jgi:hypothetical protein